VTDSLAFFEAQLGPYPSDELTVVTVPRGYSQALPGFVTLSDWMMLDLGDLGLESLNAILGLEDRRTVIAHEIAHQWWGHQVGWASYRDQWISEAMASYSALLYKRQRLDKPGETVVGPTAGWQAGLTGETHDGRPVESLGPVVLGVRLDSSKASGAYASIVYNKGAVILDMLARAPGQENFPKVLREVIRVSSGKAISTEELLDLIGRITGVGLRPFADQFVYATGLPEVYYSYRFEPRGPGKWAVVGTARQNPPYRFRYKVTRAAAGGLDVARQRLDQNRMESSMLVVPAEIGAYNPAFDKGKRRGKESPVNAAVRGHLVLRGEKSDFSMDVELEPKTLWLDRNEEVFGRFFNESHAPKRVFYLQGQDAAAAGRKEEAEALFQKAKVAPMRQNAQGEEAPRGSDIKAEAKELDARIELARARLLLDQGKDAEAEEALGKARWVLGVYGGRTGEEVEVLSARLEIHQGRPEKAFKRLRRGLLKSEDFDSTEGYLLLAIAAQATGDREIYDKAVQEARETAPTWEP
jgi:hypothetical protein